MLITQMARAWAIKEDNVNTTIIHWYSTIGSSSSDLMRSNETLLLTFSNWVCSESIESSLRTMSLSGLNSSSPGPIAYSRIPHRFHHWEICICWMGCQLGPFRPWYKGIGFVSESLKPVVGFCFVETWCFWHFKPNRSRQWWIYQVYYHLQCFSLEFQL